MKKINIKKIISNKMVLIGLAVSIIILGASLVLNTYARKTQENEAVVYNYNEAEQRLAEEVKAYLSQYLELSEQASGEIADAAVQNYDIVMESDTDVIDDEITEAVRKRIRSTIFALADNPEILAEDTLDALASGVTEIIWNAVLSELSQSDLSSSEDYKEDYEYFIQSLQEQIDALKERKTKISINANIIDNTDTEISSELLLAGIEDMNNEELLKLAEKLGISADDLTDLIETSVSRSNKDIEDNFDEKLEDEIEALRKELQREIISSAGKKGDTGATGAAGKTGAQGEKGDTGEAGKDGKTTYIAYADDKYGTNFSLTPTETSKFVGTCITTDSTQPQDYVLYSNWQEYRTYIITSTTDPNTGVTTVHIN